MNLRAGARLSCVERRRKAASHVNRPRLRPLAPRQLAAAPDLRHLGRGYRRASRCGSTGLTRNLVDTNPNSEDEMNSYLNAAVATEHHQQLIKDATEFRRSRIGRKTKAARRRSHH